jgi:hypothetical protein
MSQPYPTPASIGIRTDTPAETPNGKTATLKSAASEWAGEVTHAVRDKIVQAGSKTDTYVREHPGRFLLGACCLGLAAGLWVGRTTKRK